MLDDCLRSITCFSVEASRLTSHLSKESICCNVIDVSVGPSFANAKSAFLVQYYMAFLCNSKSFNLDKPACYQTQSVVSPYRTLSAPTHFMVTPSHDGPDTT